ncbi:SpoIVB peptidase [Alicyclobacillus macrosporangiidus]|uniref:Stage IV sporulation protein B n=1 Tax=Alicyclobacillus macrosporangiidus TaxID=392015 RepID=A0A1I7JY97_9BACL|nr:SpoIVB peptidase [Alicyclobacillus macrosporangiidus]SFU90168.1 stage IV sporulation protein B [Alicyclobacillus macrosporangiidus]
MRHGRRCSSHVRKLCAAALSLLCLTPPVQQLASLPGEIHIPIGEHTILPLRLPCKAVVVSSDTRVVGAQPVLARGHETDLEVTPRELGDAIISTRLFGFLPWKALHVHVVPQERVFAGGQSIGVRLHSNGLIVVGFQRVDRLSPPPGMALRIGDVIERIDGKPVHEARDLRREANAVQGPVRLSVRRGAEHLQVVLTPATGSDGYRRLGLLVREKTAGVGTLTFYDAHHHRFGALGHLITDVDTGQPIEGWGSVHEAEVTGVVRGTAGHPGEKQGRFLASVHEIGRIDVNTDYGVFGEMDALPRFSYLSKEVPVALPEQVHPGPAKLLTVIHGQQVEAFDVEIENVARQDRPGTKSLVVHVTDPRLLRMTGGIVQGMSGSPLLQDGRLAAAVTHVFVSDPTRGYGVYAAWMLQKCETFPDRGSNRESNREPVGSSAAYGGTGPSQPV